jgi:hypothetical protein
MSELKGRAVEIDADRVGVAVWDLAKNIRAIAAGQGMPSALWPQLDDVLKAGRRLSQHEGVGESELESIVRYAIGKAFSDDPA